MRVGIGTVGSRRRWRRPSCETRPTHPANMSFFVFNHLGGDVGSQRGNASFLRRRNSTSKLLKIAFSKPREGSENPLRPPPA
jgi:hypothetical protein